jgi:hypothetical protein
LLNKDVFAQDVFARGKGNLLNKGVFAQDVFARSPP